MLTAALLAALYSSLLAYLEFNSPHYGHTVMRTGFQMYGQGGPLFTLLTCVVLFCLYLAVFLLPFWPCRLVTIVPQPLLFYSYISFNLLLNAVTIVGAILLLSGRSAGMCATSATTFIYFSCLPGLAFVCFVRPWLRVSQPNLLMSYRTGGDGGGGEGEDASLPEHGSVHSLVELPEPSIIKHQQAGFVNTPIYSAGILSPVSATGEEGFLIATS
jgi:hypothetical protein